VVAVDTAHHITHRGNARRTIFESDSDRLVYLSLLQNAARGYRLGLLGYCLMPNHVHLIVVPHQPDSMAKAIRQAHGRYAAYFNTRRQITGHLWQGRYYSCPMDDRHLWTALRYVERNPVRAGLCESPGGYPWSSARLHFTETRADGLLDLDAWRGRWTADDWREFVTCGSQSDRVTADEIRRATAVGRPLGPEAFVRSVEAGLGRSLTAGRGGRPRRECRESQQESAEEVPVEVG